MLKQPGEIHLILQPAPTARLTTELIAREIQEIQLRQSFKRLRNGAWRNYSEGEELQWADFQKVLQHSLISFMIHLKSTAWVQGKCVKAINISWTARFLSPSKTFDIHYKEKTKDWQMTVPYA